MTLLVSSKYTFINVNLANIATIQNNHSVDKKTDIESNKPNGTQNQNDLISQYNVKPDIEKHDTDDYKAQFNAKLDLINKYVQEYIILDKYDKKIDVNKILNDYTNNYEEGVKYCDELIESFDHDRVERIVKRQYNKANQARYNAGKLIADNWVEAINSAGMEAAELNTSGVNKNNVLDVIGAFVLNEEVKDGPVTVYDLFEDTKMADTLVNALKGRAEDFIKRKDLDPTTAKDIIFQTNNLVDAKDAYTHQDLKSTRKELVNSYMRLAQYLRKEEAKLNDAAAPQYYGVPESYNMKITSQTDRATEEKNAHNNRTILNRNC